MPATLAMWSVGLHPHTFHSQNNGNSTSCSPVAGVGNEGRLRIAEMLVEQSPAATFACLQPHRRDCAASRIDSVKVKSTISTTNTPRVRGPEPSAMRSALERRKHVHGPSGSASRSICFKSGVACTNRTTCEYRVGPLEACRSLNQAVQQRAPGGTSTCQRAARCWLPDEDRHASSGPTRYSQSCHWWHDDAGFKHMDREADGRAMYVCGVSMSTSHCRGFRTANAWCISSSKRRLDLHAGRCVEAAQSRRCGWSMRKVAAGALVQPSIRQPIAPSFHSATGETGCEGPVNSWRERNWV